MNMENKLSRKERIIAKAINPVISKALLCAYEVYQGAISGEESNHECMSYEQFCLQVKNLLER